MQKIDRKLLRDIKTSKWQFIAVTLIVVLGVAFYGAYYMAFQNLGSSYKFTYRELKFADFTVKLTGEAPESIVSELESLQGVRAVEGRVNKDVGFHMQGMPGMIARRIVARVISLPTDERAGVNDVYVKEGSYFSKEAKREALVEISFAEYHGIRPGSIIHLVIDGKRTPLKVRGIVSSPEYIWVVKSKEELLAPPDVFGVVFVPKKEAQKMLGVDGKINEVVVTLWDKGERKEAINRAERVLKPYGVKETITQNQQPSNMMLQMDLDSFSKLAIMFSALFLTIAGMVIYVILTRMMHAQREEIGVMRALGYSQQRILIHYLEFALIVGLIGSAVGALLGYLISIELAKIYATILGLPLLQIRMYWGTVAIGALFGVLVSLIAGFVPARKIAALPPAEAMREETPPKGQIPLIERIFPGLSRLRLLWKMPIRNLFRNRRRTIYTAIGVASAVSLILVSAAFFDAFDASIQQQYYDIQAYDAKVNFAGLRNLGAVADLKKIKGVRDAQPVLEVPVVLKIGGEDYATAIVGIPQQQDLYNLFDLEGRPTLPRGDGILLGSGIRKNMTVDVGDTIEIEGLSIKSTIKVVGFVQEPIASLGFLELSELQDIFNLSNVITGAMLEIPPEDMREIRPKLYTLAGASVEIMSETRKYIGDLMDLFLGFIGVMLIFGTALAFAIIFNTTTISVLERRREIATMRTIGMNRREITFVITAENLLVGILGIVAGIPLGYYLSVLFIGIYQSDWLSMNAVLYPRTYILTVAGIVLVLLLSEIPSIRYVNRLELAKVTKERVG